ncbi:MAG: hypothetical protein AAF545_06130 [Pseudomonadota bacterium]
MTKADPEKERTKNSFARRALHGVCTLALIVSLSVLIFTGVRAVTVTVIGVAFASMVISSAVAAESIGEILSAFVEALMDGVGAIFEAIASAISSILP